MTDDERITKLLALKRYEQPPQGYHEAFLQEFRRRQRAAAMRRNPFSLWLESLTDLWPNFQVPRLAYAGIAAAAVAVAAFSLMDAPAPSTSLAGRTDIRSVYSVPDLSLAPQRPVEIRGALPASTHPGSPAPHFVLEARPASNDLPLSF